MLVKTTLANRECYVYSEAYPQAVLLQPIDDHDEESLEEELCQLLSAKKPILFVAFKITDWFTELSPWDASAAFGKQSFGHGAGDTLCYIEERLLPALRDSFSLPSSVNIFLGGYSLAGFFALWAAYQTSTFHAIVAASPSVWMSGWMDYAKSHTIKTRKVYLSLGDKEEKTRNELIKRVGDYIRCQAQILEDELGTDCCVLEWNPGNHFVDTGRRTGKGFCWLLGK